MKYDYKGIKKSTTSIEDFIDLLNDVDDNVLWLYQGLIVEIDPTIDFLSNNVLVRWTDINEGFNDKTIYYSLKDFQNDFTLND